MTARQGAALAGSGGLAKSWETDSLEEHVALVKRQVSRSLEDMETVQLARKIVSGKADGRARVDGVVQPYVEAWGEAFVLPPGPRCPMRDGSCELERLWDFWVANVRYVYDPTEYDLFCTAKLTLLAGSGDCDDGTVGLVALAKAVGFERCVARIVSVGGQEWEHIYPLIGLPKEGRGAPMRYVPLDFTVPGATPGWEYTGVAAYQDFYV